MTYGLGLTLKFFVAESKNPIERLVMRFGVGLGIFPILSIIFNFFHIPLDWRIFLVLSLIAPVVFLIKFLRKENIKFNYKIKIKKSYIYILLVFFIFIGTFFMYHTGSFKYPYLENSDPWSHAEGAKYVSIEKTAFEPFVLPSGKYIFTYMDPYPPAYDILMGVLHQTNNSINWTLKFFNALIISLGILFFYFFAKEFIGDDKKALFSTFIFSMIPSYLSHFIWAHALIITVFFPTMYCLERVKYDKNWWFIAGILIGSLFVIQPTQPIKLIFLIFIYFLVKSLVNRKIEKELLFAQTFGILLSLFWWGAMLVKYNGIYGIASTIGYGSSTPINASSVSSSSGSIFSSLLKLFSPSSGTASRAYNFADFFITKHTNMINNPIGIGIFISLLVILSVIVVVIFYKGEIRKKNYWSLVTLAWLLFTFLGVNSITFNLPIGLIPFRFWMLLTIPISLICAEGMWFLLDKGKKFSVPALIIILIVIAGVWFTSGSQKYSVNTAFWPTKEYYGAAPQLGIEFGKFFGTLPKGTSVFTYSPWSNDLVIGFDMYTCSWCEDIYRLEEVCMLNYTTPELHLLLNKYDYKYLLITGKDFEYIGDVCGNDRVSKEMPERIQEFVSSDLFNQVYQKDNLFIAFKIK